MAPKKTAMRRKSLDAAPDLISDLPREIIDNIMERLPMRDAARLSFLSHKWWKFWNSIPQLIFDQQLFAVVFSSYAPTSTQNFVSKILFEHNGPLVKFSFVHPYSDLSLDVNPWICYLSNLGIRDLSLEGCKKPVQLTSRLFSLQNLEGLKLRHFIFKIPSGFRGFPKLLSLDLDDVTVEGNGLKKLIANSPLLKNLSLTSCLGMTDITVDAPNLCCLTVDGTFSSLRIKNTESLVSAFVGSLKKGKFRKPMISSLINSLERAPKLEKLGFGGYFCNVLFEEQLIHTNFEKVKNLKLSSITLLDVYGFASVISCIESCPNVEELDISVKMSQQLEVDMLNFNTSIRLNHLSRASVECYIGSNSELKLIEAFLACAPQLEKLSVVTSKKSKNLEVMILKQMNRFHRASQKAEILFPDISSPKVASDDSYSSEYSSSDYSSDED